MRESLDLLLLRFLFLDPDLEGGAEADFFCEIKGSAQDCDGEIAISMFSPLGGKERREEEDSRLEALLNRRLLVRLCWVDMLWYCYLRSQQQLISFANANFLKVTFSVCVDANVTKVTFLQMCRIVSYLFDEEWLTCKQSVLEFGPGTRFKMNLSARGRNTFEVPKNNGNYVTKLLVLQGSNSTEIRKVCWRNCL